MNRGIILRRLLWKDVVTILPLFKAALLAVVGLNLSFYALWPEPTSLVGWSIALWIFLPSVVALGAAAMLVGSEDDSGTMDWLRTLPVRWQDVAASKLWVATAVLLATWVIASLPLYLISLHWEIPYRSQQNIADLFSLSGMLGIGFYALLLMLLGFVATYWIRPAMMALLALVPMYAVVALLFAFAVSYLNLLHGTGSPEVYGLGGLLLFGVWLLQRWLARRRLLSPKSNVIAQVSSVIDVKGGYRPTRLPVHIRPSEVVSLLWQQVRQIAPVTGTLIAISAFGSLVLLADVQWRGMAWLIVMLSASSLGALAFYGDNRYRRCVFFADRGISPTRVWWTRLLPPVIAFAMLLAIVALAGGINFTYSRDLGPPTTEMVIMCAVLFAFGQLVSQWSDRPVLAFFAAPAYTAISLMPVFYLASRLGSQLWPVLLVIPVLFFASWRLTRSWLEGHNYSTYSLRVIAYTALAVALPCLWIGGQRLIPMASYMLAEVSLQAGITP